MTRLEIAIWTKLRARGRGLASLRFELELSAELPSSHLHSPVPKDLMVVSAEMAAAHAASLDDGDAVVAHLVYP